MEVGNFNLDAAKAATKPHLKRSNAAESSIERIRELTTFFAGRYRARGYDDSEKRNMEILARWTARHYAGCAEKGLALFGDVGRGKTFGMECLAKIRGLRVIQARDLVHIWSELGHDGVKAHLNGIYQPSHDPFWADVVIDDIGTEPTLNEYGTKREVMDDVLQMRVDAYHRAGALTCLTFNLPLEPVPGKPESDCVANRYDERFLSRLHEICHVMSLSGPDRRRQ